MKVSVQITNSFQIALKPLLKKYPSLSNDLLQLEKELLKNPKLGSSLGNNAFKIRLKFPAREKEKVAEQELSPRLKLF